MAREKSEPRPTIPGAVTLRGTPEWLEWLDGLRAAVDELGVGVERTQVIDYALRRLAGEVGVPPPPPRL